MTGETKSIYIGGSAEGSTIVMGDHDIVNSPYAQTGGTRIGRIDATKVTVGADIQGGTPSTAGKVAREILDGQIAIDDVKGEDVVVGTHRHCSPANKRRATARDSYLASTTRGILLGIRTRLSERVNLLTKQRPKMRWTIWTGFRKNSGGRLSGKSAPRAVRWALQEFVLKVVLVPVKNPDPHQSQG